ncbi:hypothetical protein ABPG72_005210 [Tetrahymena utriculariae]
MSDSGSNTGKITPYKMEKTQSFDIIFKDIKYSVSTKQGHKEILKGIDGICKSGQVNAILGSSGAGKTTLLNILCQRIQSTKKYQLSGEVLVNKTAFNAQQFNKFATYVMQDDVLLETMTVKECFQFAANLKTKGTTKEKNDRVQEMIKQLKLEICQNTFVGGLFVKGISGGEKKRTSIGYELISDPAAIFLDEPTSGLDSFTAYSIIELLRRFAHNKNKTVTFTIHQPSSDIWELFDRVMLMVEGRLIYQGPGGLNVVNHFSSIGFKCPQYSNPADYLMSIMHAEGEDNVKNYPIYFQGYETKLKSIVSNEIANVHDGDIPNKQVQTSMLYQAGQIAMRQVRILQRNPLIFKARLVQSIIISLFIGAIYWQIPGPHDNPSQRSINDKNGFLFFWCIGMFMMTLNPCVLTFPSERAVFLREENAQLYTVSPYFLGKFIVDAFPAAIFPVISCFIVYWMVGLNDENAGKVFIFILICAILGLTGLGLGYLGGSAFSNAQTAIAVTPMLLMPFMLFAGFYKNASDYASWIGWIQYISPFKYSFQAVVINEYTYDGAGYPQDPIKQLNFDQGMWSSLGSLVGLFVGFTLISFIFLATLKKRVQ